MEEKKEVFKRNNYNKTDSGMAFMLCNIIPLVFMFFLLFVALASGVDTSKLENELWYLIVSALISQVSFVITAFFINKINKIPLSASKLSFKIDWKMVIFCVVLAFVCFFGLYNFIEVFGYLFDSIGYKFSGASLPLNTGWDLVLNLLLLGLLPAICEEFVFRGIIFNGLKNAKGNVFAVVCSSLLFALMHGNLAQFVYPFIMGLIFSMIVLRTGNLIYSMIVHFVNNSLVLVFSFANIGFSFGNSLWGILLSILVAGLAFGVLFLIDKFMFNHKTSENMKEEERQKEGLNLFMYIGIGISALMFLINLFSSF